ncbi:MAG: uroporphyrinogen decarboxylase family protein [Bacteroidota bacterium]
MDRKPVDRVPVMCQLSIGHMLLQLGVSPAEFWCDPQVYVDGLFSIRETYDFDGILVSLHGHNPEWRKNIAGRQTRNAGEEILWVDGSRTLFPPDDLPIHTPSPNGGETDDPSLWEATVPIHYIPVSQGLRFDVHPAHRYDVLEDVVRRSGGRYSVHGEITSPFDYFLDRAGSQAGLLVLIDDPDAAHKILSAFTAKIVALAEGMCSTGIDAIKISSPFAGAGFISPAFYATFVQPYERRIIAAIRARGVKAYLHTCGAIRDRLELMIGSGADGIECLDPPPLGTIELDEALRQIGGRCFVKGNVDSVNVLLRGTRPEILADVSHRLAAGRKAGGYILSTACSIAPHVPRENVLILREAVEGR